jgi:hypothetical protein
MAPDAAIGTAQVESARLFKTLMRGLPLRVSDDP